MNGDPTATGNSTRVHISISQKNMLASMVLRKPPPGEPPITVEEILRAVEEAGVIFGLAPAAIEEALSGEEYHTPIAIANGLTPVVGVHARFEYHFNTAYDYRPVEDENGHIDYRNINFIQNAEKDQALVTKIPPTSGTPGKSVFGRLIKAFPGADLPFKRGLNTEVSEDGLQLIATAAGAIQFKNSLVSILDCIVILGDVNHSVGNLDCRGSVRVTGDVKAGFRHKIDGDLEVNGNMEDCHVEVGGNVYLKGGSFGNGKCLLKADGDIMLKYAEGQRMSAGHEIHVGGEMINCQASAGESILVKSRRGRIVGGRVEAGKEIRTANLGSDANTATIVNIATDRELLTIHAKLKKELNDLANEHRRVEETLYSLFQLKQNNRLTPEKQEALVELGVKQKELPVRIEYCQMKSADIEETISQIKDARIVIEDTLYPGVRVEFGLISRRIVSKLVCCQISLMGNKIVISNYKRD